MNQREPTTAPKGAGQALPCLALLLLPLFMAQRAWSRPPVRLVVEIGQESKPYLTAIGAPLLRFAEAAPPPDLVGRPAAGAPPHPVEGEEAGPDAATKPGQRKAVVPPTAQADVTLPPAPVSGALPVNGNAKKPVNESSDASAPETRTPPPILQDELHPPARPEDFLPYFQIPTAHPGDANIVVPVPRTPAPLPQSSATYTQTPK